MYSAHRKLNPNRPGHYLTGWEIIDRNLTVLKTVSTKKQARAIIDAQDLNAKPASAKGSEKKSPSG